VVSTLGADPDSQYQPADTWRTRRIWIGGIFGAKLAGSHRILDFWPLGGSGSLGSTITELLDLAGPLFLLPLAGLVVGLLIAAGIALWHGHVRRMASSVAAIIAIPICMMIIAKVSLFDPWFWYAMADRTRFEAIAASGAPANGPKYAVLEGRDVSTGLAGLGPNHFVLLIYDESDAVGLDPSERPGIWRTRTLDPERDPAPSIPKGRRLFGHFFRVDEFE
jgi:hypothetical protein